jgi:hypothetical protein
MMGQNLENESCSKKPGLFSMQNNPGASFLRRFLSPAYVPFKLP